jgi:hypothetical protein
MSASTRMLKSVRSLGFGLLSALLVVVSPAAVSCAAARPASPAVPAPRQDSGVTETQRQDIEFYAAVLENPTSDPDTRRGAAQRLSRMDVQPAIDRLALALGSGDGLIMLAVIEAMTTAPVPVAGLLEPAVTALRTCPPEALEPLAVALARYDDRGLTRVADLALDPDISVGERLGAVHALQAFPRREAVGRLLQLVDPARGEDEAIRAAAFVSLGRLAPVELGTDYAAWRTWWEEARRKSPEEWDRELLRQRGERIAELEQANGGLADRYVELLRELYRSFEDLAEEQTHLSTDLDDELAAVRRFAMDRIARHARDSERIDEALKQKVVARLDDPEPALRLRAARLLDELDYPTGDGMPSLADLIADRLPQETDRQVILGYLELIAKRPTPRAAPSLEDRLADAQFGDPAAEALWQVITDGAAATSIGDGTRQAVRGAVDARRTPRLARLLAAVGDDEDLGYVVGMLDDPDAAIRSAVAEGLCTAGHREPLLERADDPAVYPWALLVVTTGPADLDNFRVLVGLAPADDVRDLWSQRVRTLAADLDPALVLEADRLLEEVPYAEADLRAVVLARAGVLPAEALSIEQRTELLVRLTPLLLDTGDALRAFELLEALNGAGDAPALRELKFRAGLAAGRFEAAAAIHAEPGPWVLTLEELAATDVPAAVRLRDEIERRFADGLDEVVRARLDAASATLPAATEVVGEPDTDS